MSCVVAFDPAATTGWASMLADELVGLDAVTSRTGETVEAFAARAWDAATRPLLRPVRLVLIEEPPSQVRNDVHHGPQAWIGYQLGLRSGALGAVAVARNPDVQVARVAVGAWRTAMVAGVRARFGVVLDPHDPPGRARAAPTAGGRMRAERAPDGLGHVLRWDGCDHATPLIGPLSRAPTACPDCRRRPSSRAVDVTDGWKRCAVHAVRLMYPAALDLLVARARARARVEQEDHELSGVADACEAACLCVWGPECVAQLRA